jgi:hypothetical protein
MAGLRITDLPIDATLNSTDYFLKCVFNPSANTYSTVISPGSIFSSLSGVNGAINVGGATPIYNSSASTPTTLAFNTLATGYGIDSSLQNNVITLSLSPTNIITNSMLKDNIITTSNIVDQNVTFSKLETSVQNTLNTINQLAIYYSDLLNEYNSQVVCKAWVNFNGASVWTTPVIAGASTTPTIIINSGNKTGTYIGSWKTTNNIGQTYTISASNVFTFGDSPTNTKVSTNIFNIKFISISSDLKTANFTLDGANTYPYATNTIKLSGNGTPKGSNIFSVTSNGIRSAYNISNIIRVADPSAQTRGGCYRFYFNTPMNDANYTIVTGGSYEAFVATDVTKQNGDYHRYDPELKILDQQTNYFTLRAHDYNSDNACDLYFGNVVIFGN